MSDETITTMRPRPVQVRRRLLQEPAQGLRPGPSAGPCQVADLGAFSPQIGRVEDDQVETALHVLEQVRADHLQPEAVQTGRRLGAYGRLIVHVDRGDDRPGLGQVQGDEPAAASDLQRPIAWNDLQRLDQQERVVGGAIDGLRAIHTMLVSSFMCGSLASIGRWRDKLIASLFRRLRNNIKRLSADGVRAHGHLLDTGDHRS